MPRRGGALGEPAADPRAAHAGRREAAGDDVLSTLVSFAQALRAAGVGVDTDRLGAFLGAFAWLDPLSLRDVRNAACATLLSRRSDRETLLRVFDAFFLARVDAARAPERMPIAPRHRGMGAEPALASLLSAKAARSDPELDVRDRSRAASDEERLRRMDFGQMTPDELRALRRLLARPRLALATRATHRYVAARRGGTVDLRGAVASAARSGGVLLELPRCQRKVKPRQLVVLADVSGSMEIYARVLLQLVHGLSRQLPRLETFVFATRLTRITEAMESRSPDEALGRVAQMVVDFASGTRIAASLGEFNRRWAGRVLERGCVVLVVSDGWERGSTSSLPRELRLLRARTHRLIWLNPRLGEPRYEPLVEGMRAALPYIDDFLPCHNVQSLEALTAHLAALSRRRGETPALAASVSGRARAGERPRGRGPA